ncbi:glutaredoxin family protein [Desulfobacterota bacterium AH_259_B03_O07]|nr:glutaredoxin family protein [Desulfobacterota bacterium AH_259_B03_O07]
MQEIRIYTTPTCAYCKMAKEYMKEKGVDFKEYNVAQDREALNEMVQLTGLRSVPVITCGRDVMVGFDPDRLDQMINCARQQSSVPE